MHALLATRNGTCGQKVGQARAWMLPASIMDGPFSATCRIKPNTRLVVDVAGVFDFYKGPEKLKASVAATWKDLQSAALSVDGQSLKPHRIQTPFLHARMPYYNAQLFGTPKTTISFVSRDYFAILSPLPKGWHTLIATMTFSVPSGPKTYTATFHLNVR